jgi:hypothetical protein
LVSGTHLGLTTRFLLLCRIWDSKIWSQVPWDSNPRMTALTESLQSNSKLKLQCGCRSGKQIVMVSSPIWGSWPDIYYCLTVTVLFLWGALFDERTLLSFVYAAGPHQRGLSRVRVTWISRPYFTVSVFRLPFSSPPTTRRVTVEVFDLASTRVSAALPASRLPIYRCFCSARTA